MYRLALVMVSLLGVTLAFAPLAFTDDGSKGAGCKAGWHMCGCKTEDQARNRCETDDLWKKCNTCWGAIAQFQCLQGAKNEVMDKAFAEAKKTDKLVLYIGNTGG